MTIRLRVSGRVGWWPMALVLCAVLVWGFVQAVLTGVESRADYELRLSAQRLDIARLRLTLAQERTLGRLIVRSWSGVASFYDYPFHGRPTASGAIYDRRLWTAAHKTLPLGTVLIVENPVNGRRIAVVVNDRGPFIPGREIDLSKAAADALGFTRAGLALVRLYEVGRLS